MDSQRAGQAEQDAEHVDQADGQVLVLGAEDDGGDLADQPHQPTGGEVFFPPDRPVGSSLVRCARVLEGLGAARDDRRIEWGGAASSRAGVWGSPDASGFASGTTRD